MRAVRLAALAVLLCASLVGLNTPAPVSASESGCSISATPPWLGSTRVYAQGGFYCSGNDTGARQVQVCLIIGGTWYVCNSWNTTGWNFYGQASCVRSSVTTTYEAKTWTWVYWENGTTNTAYSATSYHRRCA
jgi:hypothetical protein